MFNSQKRKSIIGRNIKDNTLIEFTKMSDGVLKGFGSGHLSNSCQQKLKQYKGYIWFYKEEYSEDEFQKRLLIYKTPYRKPKIDIKEKACMKYNIVKSIDDFYNRNQNSNGKDSYCKDCIHKKNREYASRRKKNDPEYLEKSRKQSLEYYHKVLKFDLNKKIASNLNRRLRCYVKSNKIKIMDLVGCSIEIFKKHIESQFNNGMTWDNYGPRGWHFDHIRPLHTFDFSDKKQIKLAYHYTNIRPLNWLENISRPKKERHLYASSDI